MILLTYWIIPSLLVFLLWCISSRLEGEPISKWDNAGITNTILLSIVWPAGFAIFIAYLLYKLVQSIDWSFLLREW